MSMQGASGPPAFSAPSVAAGWYPDPQQAGVLRYWDGTAWTGHTHHAAASGWGQPVRFAPAAPVPTGPGQVLRVLLLLQAVGFGILFLVGVNYRRVGTKFLDEPAFSGLDDVNGAEDAYFTTFGLLVLFGIATFVALVVWAYRTAKWAEGQGAALRLSPGWAIGAWFIPIANFVLPFMVLNDLFRCSEPTLGRPIGAQHRGRPGSGYLWGWLVGWVTTTVCIQWSATLFDVDDAASDLKLGLTLRMLAPVASAVSVIMLLLFVRATSSRLERAGTASSAPPAAYAPWTF